MEINNAISTPSFQPSSVKHLEGVNKQAAASEAKVEIKKELPSNQDAISNNDEKSEKLKEDNIQKEIDELNKGVEAFNTALHFKLHKETGVLMVRFVDTKTNEIIKEYPPEELLDKKARIKEFIGMIFDDKA